MDKAIYELWQQLKGKGGLQEYEELIPRLPRSQLRYLAELGNVDEEKVSPGHITKLMDRVRSRNKRSQEA